MKRTLLFLCLLLCTVTYAQNKVKVACVGNSVTYGAGIENREINAYPAQLQRMLGDGYEVMNFGKSGATLLYKGHRPYREQDEYKAALGFAADRVVIHLGLNDTDPRNWPNYRDDFVSDYLSLIDSFRKANPNCRIWICRMTPISHRHPRFKSGTRDWYRMEQETIEEIARLANTGLIDLQACLYNRPDLLPDALHPTAEGAGILAKTIYQELTGNYGGLQMPVTYSDNMVLQREKPLLISGTANAGQQVTVRIAGQKKETVTGSNGKWSVTLDPLQAGGPYELAIEAFSPTDKKNRKKIPASRKLVYKDVLVGEVWLCSGQSNMAFRVDELVDSQRKELLEYAGKQPQIRFFNRQPRWYTNAEEWDASVMDSLNRLQYYHDTQWTTCNEQTADRFSAVAFAFGRMLSDSLQVPVGLILNAIGGSGTEAWIDRKTLEFDFTDILYDWTQNDFIQDWVRGRAMLNTKKSANKLQRHPYEPCYLYETGIEPLQQYPIKGVIWYQGESNAQNIETHERLFPLLVNSWRENWREELPFYYVQLSSIDRPSWTWFRNSQRKMMETIPNCGMAVSSDRGDSLNVHPRYKREIGERLARWALNKTYGQPVIPSGPLFRSIEFKDAAAYISFDYAEGLHTSDGQPVRTFEIAEHDGLFVPAQAEIIGGKVKVWNEKITNPKLVRYGWQPFTRANLVNGEELPASTFRTEIKPKEIMINWSKLPDLPGMADTASLGVSAPFVGISNGKLLVAGGCNFPDKPVTEGGAKKYYSDIFALDLSAPAAGWKKAGNLPHPVAYGAAAVTPEGIVCIGGNNSDSFFPDVYLLSWNKTDEKADIRKLPSLPAPMDNLSATYIDNTVYVAGGNKNTHPCNTFLSMEPATGSNWNSLPGFPGAARVQPVLAAQKAEDGTRIYLAGGFQPIQNDMDAIVPTDMLSYHPASKTWRTETKLPVFANGYPRTFTGGCAVSYSDSSILLMSGVNYDCFFNAINRPRRMARAVDESDTAGIESLEREAKEYMHHPVEWYKFNTTLLQYNTFTKEWKELGNYEQLARAGAGAVLTGDSLIIVNGELKPGIRTPQVNCAQIK